MRPGIRVRGRRPARAWFAGWLGILLLAGCAGGPGPGSPPESPRPADDAAATCEQRLAAEGADPSSVAGKLRRENCLDALRLAPRIAQLPAPIIEATLRFAECKADARRRNLPLVDHQQALFACARREGGAAGEACLTEMVFAKVPVDAMEAAFGHCLQSRQGAPR